MNLTEIKAAIAEGKKVYWSNEGYEVIRDNIGQWLIHCNINDTYIGLTHRDNVTMNCNHEGEFFMLRPDPIKAVMGKFSIVDLRKAREIAEHFDSNNRLNQPLMADIDKAIELLTRAYR